MDCETPRAAQLEQLLGNGNALPSQLNGVVAAAKNLLQAVEIASEDDTEYINLLLRALRALRNSCAGGRDVCEQLQALGLIDLLAATVDAIGSGAAALNWQLPSVAAQLLANAAAGSPGFAAAAWAELFPARLLTLAHIRSVATQTALSLALLTCARTVPGAASALASPLGGPILAAQLCGHQQLQAQQDCNDTLGLLLCHLCLDMGLLGPAFLSLGEQGTAPDGANPSGSNDGGWECSAVSLTAAHVLLLQELAAESQHAPGGSCSVAEADEECPPRSGASMRFLVDLVQQLASPAVQQTAPPSPAQQVLQDGMQLMRDLAARDDSGAALAGGADLVAALQAAGAVPVLLSMLRALGPVRNPRRRDAGDPAAEFANVAPALRRQSESFPAEPPYHGYRTDILSVLANAAHARPAVQAAVTAVGGTELVLAQCQVDEASPLAREWGLWAVRNLCEGSEDARAAIAALQACAAVDGEELQRAGVKLTLDEATGKLRVEKREEGGELDSRGRAVRERTAETAHGGCAHLSCGAHRP